MGATVPGREQQWRRGWADPSLCSCVEDAARAAQGQAPPDAAPRGRVLWDGWRHGRQELAGSQRGHAARACTGQWRRRGLVRQPLATADVLGSCFEQGQRRMVQYWRPPSCSAPLQAWCL